MPQRKAKKRGKSIVSTKIRVFKVVISRTILVNEKSTIPSLNGDILSLKYPLRYPPIIAPIPLLM